MVVLVLAVVPAFLGESHFAFLGYSLNLSQTPMRRQLDYLRVLGASKETAKELKLFGLAGYITGQYARLSDDLYSQNVALSRRRLAVGSLLSVVSSGQLLLGLRVCDLSHGERRPVVGLAAVHRRQHRRREREHPVDLRDVLEHRRPVAVPHRSRRVLPREADAADGARTRFLRRGRFATASCSRTSRSSTPATRGRSSTTSTSASRRGERVALVGENGQGKTTLVKLITRLYDPTAGRVLLDGVDLREYDIEDLHREIGVIFQDFVRYEMSARDEHRRRPAAGRRRRLAHPQGGRPQPGARRHLAAAAGVRPAARPPLRRRRRPLGR